MSKTNAQLQAEIKELNKDHANAIKFAQIQFAEACVEKDKANEKAKYFEELCASQQQTNKALVDRLNNVSDAESELHRRDALKPTEAIFEILHKLELPEQVMTIFQIAATKSNTIRHGLAEANNTAKYYSNILNDFDRNMARVADGSTTQP